MDVAAMLPTRPNGATPFYGHRVAADAVRYLRNYLLGLWAASELNLNDPEADRYAAEMARFGERASDDRAIVHLVRADIAAAGGNIDAEVVARRLLGFERSAVSAMHGRDAVIVYPAAA